MSRRKPSMRSLGRNLSKEAIVERGMEEDDEGEHHHYLHLAIFIITIIKIIVFNNTTMIREVATNGRSSAPNSLGRTSGTPASLRRRLPPRKYSVVGQTLEKTFWSDFSSACSVFLTLDQTLGVPGGLNILHYLVVISTTISSTTLIWIFEQIDWLNVTTYIHCKDFGLETTTQRLLPQKMIPMLLATSPIVQRFSLNMLHVCSLLASIP